MARGSLVGDAYVRIHADTRFMKRAIDRDLNQAAKKAGKKDAGSYLENFDKTLRQAADAKLKNAQRDLANAIVGGDFDAMLKKSGKSVDEFTADIQRDLVKISRVGRVKTRDLGAWFESLNNWADDARWREQLGVLHTEAIHLNDEFDKNIKLREKQEILGERLAQQAEKNYVKKMTEDWKTWRVELGRGGAEQTRLIHLLDRSGVNVKKVSLELSKGHSLFSRMSTQVGRVTNGFDKMGDSVGKMFGKGSRNDFLNVFGGMVGGIAKLAGAPFYLIKAGLGQVGEMVDQFKALRLSGSSLAGALGTTLGGALKTGVVGLGALAAAIIGASIALPALVSGVVLLTGALTAMVGAISIGVVGALLPLGPLLIGAAGGFMAVVLAVNKMKEQIKAHKKEVGYMPPLLHKWDSAMKDLKKSAEGSTEAILKATGGIADLLKLNVGPLVKGMGYAIAGVMKDFAATFKDPTTQKFLDEWETRLPHIMGDFGRGFNELLAGLMGFFTPILDFSDRLGTNFESLMQRFNLWTKTADGQNQIKEFMDDAWEAAGHLYHIVSNVIQIVAKLFNGGNEDGGGKDFLKTLDDITDRWNKWLSSEEGQARMKQFWWDVRETMRKAKEIMGDIGTAIDNFDTEQARSDFNSFMEAIRSVTGAIETISRWSDIIASATKAGVIAANPLLIAFNSIITVTDVLNSRFGVAMASIKVGIIGASIFVVTAAQAMLSGFLTAVEGIVVGAAVAFGWVPGLGPKLNEAAGKIAGFKESANASMDAIKKELTIKLNTAQAELAAANLAAKINSIKDKSVVITATQRFVNSGRLSNGGRGTAGGSTWNASGGLFDQGPRMIGVGEAGPEAVVPLDRPLWKVDPAVRQLSAIAQGKTWYGSGGVVGGGRSINIHPGAIVVQTPHANPAIVAEAVFDRIVQFA